MKKVCWGVLGTARIAVKQVIPAMQQGQHTEVLGLASREFKKARRAATQLGVPRAYASYEELLGDPDIDAVYNPLPNHLHVPWTLRAMDAGKHVLCEKPLALSAAEACTLLEAARAKPRLKVMEAFMYRFHPQWKTARDFIRRGEIGQLRSVHTHFSYFNADPENIRSKPEWGGGGLMDIGCYPISLSRWLFEAEPESVAASLELDPDLRVDRLASALLEFGRGTATFTCASQLTPFQRVLIFGTEGRIDIEIPFNPPADRPCWIVHQRGAQCRRVKIPKSNHYTLQGDRFAQAVLQDKAVPTPLEDAVANMAVIDALFEAGAKGEWVRLSKASE